MNKVHGFFNLSLCKKAVSNISKEILTNNSLVVMEQEIERAKSNMASASNFNEDEFNEFENFIESARTFVCSINYGINNITNDSIIYFYPMVCGQKMQVNFYKVDDVVCVKIKPAKKDCLDDCY